MIAWQPKYQLPVPTVHASIALLLVNLFIGSCAARLPKQWTDNATRGSAVSKALNLSEVAFADTATGEPIDIASYMASENLSYLLVTFGSKGCSACIKKAKKLQGEVLGQHPLLLQSSNDQLGIVGVNTDGKKDGRLALHLKRYPFIKWSDPAGKVMLQHFMPEGHSFSVPLTVLLNERGILWQIAPDEGLSVDQIMAKVEATIEGRASDANAPVGTASKKPNGTQKNDQQGKPGGHPGDSTSPGDGHHVPGQIDLRLIHPSRLSAVALPRCEAELDNLDKLFRTRERQSTSASDKTSYRFVHIARDQCDETCAANNELIGNIGAICHGAVPESQCQGVSLISEDANPDLVESKPGGCTEETLLVGGTMFHEVFATHFNGSYQPVEDPTTYELTLPALPNNIVLAFDQQGRLVFSHEGLLSTEQLAHDLNAGVLNEIATGAEFPIYSKHRSETDLAALRQKSAYTVIATWGALPVPCDSCIAELQHWSQPGQLVDYCAERPNFCQVVGLETHLPDTFSGQTKSSFFDAIIGGDGENFDGMDALGIRVPLVLDPTPDDGTDGFNYLDRFFDGYLTALTPELGFEYRTLITDPEGKIIHVDRTEPPVDGFDPVMSELQSLERLYSPSN